MSHIRFWVLAACGYLAIAVTHANELSISGLEIHRPEVETRDLTNYNIILGDLSLELKYMGGASYNDNTNRAPDRDGIDAEETINFTNGLGSLIDWPITPYLRLHVDVAVEWRETVSGENVEGIYLSGNEFLGHNGAHFELAMPLDDRNLVTVSDEIGRLADIHDLSAQETEEEIVYWENIAALQYEYELSQLMKYGLRGEFRNYWTDSDAYHFIDRDEWTVTTKLRMQVNQALAIEPFMSYSEEIFDHMHDVTTSGKDNRRGNNDSREFQLGVAGDYRVAQAAELQYSIGYQWLDFANDAFPRKANDDHTEGVFGRLALDQEVTRNFQHRIEGKVWRESSLAPDVNHAEIYGAYYSFEYEFAADWAFETRLGWEHRNESDRGENWGQLFTEVFALHYVLSPKTTLSLWYSRADKESDLFMREYAQNIVGMQVIHRF